MMRIAYLRNPYCVQFSKGRRGVAWLHNSCHVGVSKVERSGVGMCPLMYQRHRATPLVHQGHTLSRPWVVATYPLP